MPNRVAIVVKGWPRLSETFIAQEIRALERRGLDVLIVALRLPTDGKIHDLHREVGAPILYLPEYLRDEPVRVLMGLVRCLARRDFGSAVATWWRDFRRDPTRNRARRIGQALVLAAELPPDVGWLYSHFIHTSASATRYAALIRRLPFSISAHAKDVWTSSDWDKREKLLAARWTVTCSAMNHAHLRSLAPGAEIELVYHGLDALEFQPPPRRAARDGRDPADPLRLILVARAVEKKGLDVLLEALALLPPELAWRLDHIGGGPLLRKLRPQAERLGIAARISWHGPAARDQVVAALGAADLFCYPAKVAGDGDRDGLPNVVLEAMAMELPVVASDVAAVSEAVVDGTTGLLVPPQAPAALAQAILALARDPARRVAMGEEGRRAVIRHFAVGAGIERLAARFGLEPAVRRAA